MRSSRSDGQLLELAAGQLLLEVERAALAVGDVGEVDGGLRARRQLDLRLLRSLLEALLGDLVGTEVDAVVVLELLDHPLDDAVVPVVTTEVVVTGGRLDLDDALADLEQGHVERAATEVEDEDGLVVALVEAVGQGRGGGLVDDAADVEARDLAGLLGRLALRVGEVRRDGDDRVGHRLAEVGLRVALELLQHERADLLGGEGLVVDLDLPVLAHVALDGPDGAVDVGDRLSLGDLADENLAGLGEGDHGRGRPGALGVGDDGGFATFEDGDDGVRRAEVDADRSSHGCYLLHRCTGILRRVPARALSAILPRCGRGGKIPESISLNSVHGVQRMAAAVVPDEPRFFGRRCSAAGLRGGGRQQPRGRGWRHMTTKRRLAMSSAATHGARACRLPPPSGGGPTRQRVQTYGVVVVTARRPERSRMGRDMSVQSEWMNRRPRARAEAARAETSAR